MVMAMRTSKKQVALLSKTTTLHVKTPVWKMSNFTFYGGRKQATMSFSFSF